MTDKHFPDLETLADYIVTARHRTTTAGPRPQVHNSEDAYRLLVPYVADADREHFYGVYLSTKNHVLAVELVSLGTLTASIVHPREVYKPAFLHSAASLLVAHNHPSGDPTPSPEDQEFTRRLAQAGELLGIRLLDHLILGDDTYVSLRERGAF